MSRDAAGTFERQDAGLPSSTEVRAKRDAFIAEHGPWTAHPIRLAQGVSTIENGVNDNHFLYLRRILQIVTDLLDKPLSQARILDLGALEGGFAVEFAMHGAACLAVDGRAINCRRIQFAKDVLDLGALEILHGDVRDLRASSIGTFDVVLCLGLFYHLDRRSIIPFCKELYALTGHLCVIDTHVALYDRQALEGYFGDIFVEHAKDATSDEIEANTWASIDANPSFFFTSASISNLMQDVGFSSLLTCRNPYYRTMLDRHTFVGLKGDHTELRSVDADLGLERHPEVPDMRVVEPLNKLPLRSLL